MKFKKGESGNKDGRPKGSKTKFSIVEMEKAIKDVEKEKKRSLFKHIVERAFVSDKVLIAVLKKLVPDAKGEESINYEWLIGADLDFLGMPSRVDSERFRKYYK